MDKASRVYSVTNLAFSYNPDITYFQNINLEIYSGEKVAIIGPNGSGKSTLLNLLSGLEKPQMGNIELFGDDLSNKSNRQRSCLVTYLSQFGKHTSINLEVVEFIEMGLFSEQGRFEHLSVTQKKRIKDAMQLFDVSDLQNRPISTLSGGEYQRARLARSFVREPKVYLLDEPSSALDVKFQLRLWQHIGCSEGDTVIAAVHNIDIATQIFDRILVLNSRGELICDTKEMTTDILEDAFEVGVQKIEFAEKVHWYFSTS